jgi:hypothetical protein
MSEKAFHVETSRLADQKRRDEERVLIGAIAVDALYFFSDADVKASVVHWKQIDFDEFDKDYE